MDTDVDIKAIKGSPFTIQMKMDNIMKIIKTLNEKIQTISAKRDEWLEKYEALRAAKEHKERTIEVQHSVQWDKGKPIGCYFYSEIQSIVIITVYL